MEEKTIGALSKFTGVSVHTIKYYEKIGLLASRRAEHSNYRSYDIRICTDIYECVRYRNMGFSLKETEKLLKEADDAMLESMLEKRVADIDEEIERLQKMRKQVRQYQEEIDLTGIQLGEWFIETMPDFYVYPQTQNLSYREDAPIDEQLFQYGDEMLDNQSVIILFKEYLNGEKQNFSWGKGFFLEKTDPVFEKRGFCHVKKGRAFVFYQKFSGHFSSNGEMAESIRKTYHRFRMEFQSDAYAFRIKNVHDADGIRYEYFKIIVPLE